MRGLPIIPSLSSRYRCGRLALVPAVLYFNTAPQKYSPTERCPYPTASGVMTRGGTTDTHEPYAVLRYYTKAWLYRIRPVITRLDRTVYVPSILSKRHVLLILKGHSTTVWVSVCDAWGALAAHMARDRKSYGPVLLVSWCSLPTLAIIAC